MEELLDDLKHGEVVYKIFENWAEDLTINSSSDNFKYLISELSVSYNLDLTDYSANMKSDLTLTWDTFRLMLIEALQTSPDLEAIAEKSLKKILKAIIEEVLMESLNFLALSDSKKKTRKRLESWITPYIQEYKSEVLEILTSFDENKNKTIKANDLRKLLSSLLQLFSITLNEKDLFLFDRMVENRYKQGSGELSNKFKYLRLTFSQSINLIEEWALKESYKQIVVKDQLKITIKELETSLMALQSPPVLKESLQSLISGLNSLQTKSSDKQNLEDLQNKGLKEIFEFYSKQIKMVGKSPTFTQITDHKSVLNLSKFTKFCSDFELINAVREKHKIALKQISNVFIKATDCQRSMNFSQFLKSIDYIAEAFYSEQYDFYYHENLYCLGPEEKRKRLLMYLHCDDPAIYSLRLKGFGQAFSNEKKDFRIPDYDLSKRYRYRDQSKVKQQISLWKEQKTKPEGPNRSKSVPSNARLKAIQQSLLMRPDRITWDLLNKNSNLITKEDLSAILDAEDIQELVNSGVKIM